jgi:predicted membrane-bound spermidine synthase
VASKVVEKTDTDGEKADLMLFFVIFALSGFCGLIYESIWSRYLGLFLGHAAYAQTLVLVIFMGGLALGSWLCSLWSVRWRNPLRGYALAEGVIGLFALLFHETFTALEPFFFNVITPRITSPAAVIAFKWGSAALLILPQSILLGMTFPLMSGVLFGAALIGRVAR